MALSDKTIERLTMISAFLVYAEKDQPGMIYGSHRITDVLNAFCEVAGLPKDRIRETFLLDKPKPGDDRHA